MSRHIEARFEIANWDETPFDDTESPKLTEALVSKKYSGDIEGTSTTKWLMAYAPDKTAAYVGNSMETYEKELGKFWPQSLYLSTWTGPDTMKSTRFLKKGRSRCTA